MDWRFDAKKNEQHEESQIKQSRCSILVLPAYFLFRCMYITQLSAALPRKTVQFNSMVILTVTGSLIMFQKENVHVI